VKYLSIYFMNRKCIDNNNKYRVDIKITRK
jgi:hypothetical protein